VESWLPGFGVNKLQNISRPNLPVVENLEDKGAKPSVNSGFTSEAGPRKQCLRYAVPSFRSLLVWPLISNCHQRQKALGSDVGRQCRFGASAL